MLRSSTIVIDFPALDRLVDFLNCTEKQEDDAAVKIQLDRIEAMLMAVKDDIQKLIQAVDDATNAIAARIQKLIDQLSGGLSADEAAAVSTSLQAEVTKLQALGADPSNPVPTA